MVLGHTILAMVGKKPARVRCNTCQGEHAFKPSEPGSGTGQSRKSGWEPKSVREKPAVLSWEARIAAKDVSAARKYTPKDTFSKEDLLQHPTFGVGIVQEVRGDKIEVAFKADVKTLVHGKR